MGQDFHCGVSSVNFSEPGWSCLTSPQTNLTACQCFVSEGWMAKAVEVAVSCCVSVLVTTLCQKTAVQILAGSASPWLVASWHLWPCA